jgi:hypothetical protein
MTVIVTGRRRDHSTISSPYRFPAPATVYRGDEWVLVDLCDHQVGGHEARAEADHAKADQIRMARDVVTMFDELKAWRIVTPPFMANRRAPNWQGRSGHGGDG